MATAVTIPLLNPNEPEAVLAGLHVHLGQPVQAGDVLCTLETTKSTAEVTAEASGYVVGLQAEAGQTLRAGDILCYLAGSPDWTPPQPQTLEQPAAGLQPGAAPPGIAPHGARLTRKAQALAQELSLDLASLFEQGKLPVGALITEQLVRQFASGATPGSSASAPAITAAENSLIIYGGGGHGKALIDLLRTLGSHQIAGIVDDGMPAGSLVMGVPVLGGGELLSDLRRQGVALAVNAVGGIGSAAVRGRVFERLQQNGFTCPAVIHPTAFVEPSASLSPGVQVFPFAYIGSDVQVGFGSIINTGAIVSHDCRIASYANISPGAILAGGVQIGERALVGMGVTINLQVQVGAGARIGNSAVVKQHVPENGLVRAGSIWPE